MTPVASLFVTLAVLHVLEGLFWIRRAATPFVRTWRGHRVARTDAPLGGEPFPDSPAMREAAKGAKGA